MAIQRGKDMLIKISEAGAFTTVAGLRATSFSLNAGLIDATSADSPQAWRELIAGAGVKKAAVSGQGVFRDAASDARLRQAFFDQELATYQLLVPDFGVLEGPFAIEKLDYTGDYDGEARFAISLASAGRLTFTAI